MGRKPIDKARKDDLEKKTRWIEAVYPFFQEHGLTGITMDDVARGIGVSKATVYKYFSSKDELVASSLYWKLHQLQGFEPIIMDGELEYIDRYYQAVQFFTKHVAEISNRYLSDLKAAYPALWEQVKEFRAYALSVIEKYYQEGMTLGVFNDQLQLSALVAGDAIFFESLSNPHFLEQYNLSLKVAFEQYFIMKFNGILPEGKSVDLQAMR